MQVILLGDVEKLGLRGEVVSVADGYARNYLLPRRIAEHATPGKVAEIQRRDAERARHEARSVEQARAMADTLAKTVLRFEVQAGPTGTLFGSVTPTNVADEIWRTRKIRVDRRKIALDEPIKRIGRYAVGVEVFEGVEVAVKTLVVPEGGELPPEEELAAMEAAERATEQGAVAADEGDAGEAQASGAEPAAAAEPEDAAPAPAAAVEPDGVEPAAGAAAGDAEPAAPPDDAP